MNNHSIWYIVSSWSCDKYITILSSNLINIKHNRILYCSSKDKYITGLIRQGGVYDLTRVSNSNYTIIYTLYYLQITYTLWLTYNIVTCNVNLCTWTWTDQQKTPTKWRTKNRIREWNLKVVACTASAAKADTEVLKLLLNHGGIKSFLWNIKR